MNQIGMKLYTQNNIEERKSEQFIIPKRSLDKTHLTSDPQNYFTENCKNISFSI